MKRKLILTSVIVILFTGLLGIAFRVERVQAAGTIYIRADGSIDPPTTNITTTDNSTYTFIGNINGSIVLERNNIVVDGAGYTLQGSGSSWGFFWHRNNVTVKNTNVKNFFEGLIIAGSSNSSIQGNNIGNNYYGIRLYVSSNNTIQGNTITANNGAGIYLDSSSNNSIQGNNITNNQDGIFLYQGASYNSIHHNNLTNNFYYGISEFYPDANYNNVSFNVFINCGAAVTGYGNVMVENVVNGKPLVYLEDISDFTVENAGQVILVNSNAIRVEGLNLSNASSGIQLYNTTNATIRNNNIANNSDCGVWIEASHHNNISENIMTGNYIGIWMYNSTDYNVISSNNITCSNFGSGVRSDFSSNCSIYGNYIVNGSSGIRLNNSQDQIILGNHIENTTYGSVSLNSCLDNIILDNTFVGGGLSVYFSYGNVVVNNSVNGKPLVYLEDASHQAVTEAGQVILVHCEYIQVINLNLSHTFVGVELWYTNSSLVCGNSITANSYEGISLHYSFNNSISSNTVTASPVGVFFGDSCNNTISDNTVTANFQGIYLGKSFTNNVFENNIVDNGLGEANGCGIVVLNSSNNWIYHNNFINNTRQVIDPSLEGYPFPPSINIWDDGYPSGGNYWSNYTDVDLFKGPGQNETGDDGIWDHSYIVDISNTDKYPLSKPLGTYTGDVDGDLDVDIFDIVRIARAYGSEYPDTNYNRCCDLDLDGDIDIFDIVAAATHYGDSW